MLVCLVCIAVSMDYKVVEDLEELACNVAYANRMLASRLLLVPKSKLDRVSRILNCKMVRLTMNITLALVSLGHEEICHMPPDSIFIAHSIASEHFL